MANVWLNHELPYPVARDKLFAGDLLLYSRNAATEALALHAQAMICEAFGSEQPQRAQFDLPVDEFIRIVGPLKSRFTNDAVTKQRVRDVMTAFGCDLDDVYFDVPRLRVVPHGDYLASGVSYAYRAHRDTWYSSPSAQVNWWMPVYDVAAERAMSMFPEYWDRAVENSSDAFDYAEWCAVGRKLASSQVGADTRKHPLPMAPVSTTSELRIAGTRGDMLIFSANQLHSTAPNASGVTRFSIDFRTVSLSDLQAGRGAPNVDSRARGSTLGDFLRGSDFAPYEVRPTAAA